MKLRVECDVQSVMKLDRAVTVSTAELEPHGFEYAFMPGPDGLLNRLAVTAPIQRPERFSASLHIDHADPTSTLTFEMDQELVQRIVAEFHAIESQLSFRFPISRIAWEWPSFRLVYDTPAERELFPVSSYTAKSETKRNPIPADEDAVVAVVASRYKFDVLTVPLSFYREGVGEFDNFRFISAFFNFYFVLEGLYGRANTKNRLVEQAFLASANFRDAVTNSLNAAKRENPAKYALVTAEFTAAALGFDPAGVTRYLVRTRGRLHHFTNSPGRLEGTPFTHQQFEVAAFLAKIVCTFALTAEMVTLGARVSA